MANDTVIPPLGSAKSVRRIRRRRKPNWRWIAAILVLLLLVVGLSVRYAEPSAIRWRQSHARQLLLQRKNVEALVDLRIALRRDLKNPETLLLIARAHRRLGNLNRVPILLSEAAENGADQDRLRLERILLLAQTGDLRETEPHLPTLLSNAGEDGQDICQAFVQGYFSNARTQDAINLLNVWQRSYPDDAEPIFMRAYLTQGLNQFSEAISLYRQGLTMDPGRTQMRLHLAESQLAARQFKAAESELAICDQEAGPSAQSQYLLSQCAYELGDSKLAIQRINSALQLDPNHFDARRFRGQLFLAEGQFEQALADLQTVAAQQPYDTFTRESLGRALRQLGRTDEAKKHLDYVAEAEQNVRQLDRLMRQSLAEPKNAELRFQIGSILSKYGPPDDAAKWMRAAIEIDPQHAGAHLSLAQFYESRGDMNTANIHRQLAAGSPPSP